MQYAFPLAIFGIALAICLVIRDLGLRWLKRHPVTRDAVRLASILWCLTAALAISLRYAQLPQRAVELAVNCIIIFVIASVTIVISNIAVRTIERYGERKSLPFAVAGLSRTLTRVFVSSIGGLILLRQFGGEITPLLTALGIGGLAVALALQDTLANFFAGIHILVESPITIGDTIKLSSGEEGTVTDIGWRTTRVLTGGHSMIVIPNTKITSGILTNFSLPSARVTAEVTIQVAHSAEIEGVAEIALDVAQLTPGVLADPAPVVLFDPGYTPTHLEFKAILNVASPAARGGVTSEYRVRLLERLRSEGIPLPALPLTERFLTRLKP